MWWWVSMRPAAMDLSERRDAGLGDLLVLVRLHARYADRADAFVLMHDGQRALDEQAGREIGEGGPLLDAILPHLGRLPRERRGQRLAGRDARGDRRRAVHALERERRAAVVDDRDRDFPVVLRRLGDAGRHHLLHVGGGQAGLGTHGISTMSSGCGSAAAEFPARAGLVLE